MKIALTLLVILMTSKNPEEFNFTPDKRIKSVSYSDKIPSIEEDDHSLNLENLYKRILKSGIEFPDVAFAQAVLESGYFKSKISLTNSNLFGMRLPKKRPTTATGEMRGFSVYESWHGSVEDYKLYQERILKNGEISRDEYLNKLNRSYAFNSLYSKKISSIIKKHQDIIGEVPAHMKDGKIEKE
jgi:uncharacterized FlgJ-related protein